MTNFEILKQEIQSWYPGYEFTDKELNNMINGKSDEEIEDE